MLVEGRASGQRIGVADKHRSVLHYVVTLTRRGFQPVKVRRRYKSLVIRLLGAGCQIEQRSKVQNSRLLCASALCRVKWDQVHGDIDVEADGQVG